MKEKFSGSAATSRPAPCRLFQERTRFLQIGGYVRTGRHLYRGDQGHGWYYGGGRDCPQWQSRESPAQARTMSNWSTP